MVFFERLLRVACFARLVRRPPDDGCASLGGSCERDCIDGVLLEEIPVALPAGTAAGAATTADELALLVAAGAGAATTADELALLVAAGAGAATTADELALLVAAGAGAATIADKLAPLVAASAAVLADVLVLLCVFGPEVLEVVGTSAAAVEEASGAVTAAFAFAPFAPHTTSYVAPEFVFPFAVTEHVDIYSIVGKTSRRSAYQTAHTLRHKHRQSAHYDAIPKRRGAP